MSLALPHFPLHRACLMLARCSLVAFLLLTPATAPSQQATGSVERPAGSIKRLPDGRAGEFYEYLVAVQGLVEPIQYQWGGNLPKGLQAAGPRCWGVPQQHTTSPVQLTVVVEDALGASLRQQYVLSIRPVITALRVATNSLPTFVLGQSVSHEITASGGEGPYQWKADASTFPEGLAIELSPARDRCFLKGKPTQTGDIRLTISVSDALTSIGPVTLTGRVGPAIAPALEIASTTLPVARYKIQYSQTLVAAGGLPPYTWSLSAADTSIQDWLSLNPSTGVLSGIPPRIGITRLTVRVVDSLGSRAEKTGLELRVEPPTEPRLAIHPTSLPRAVAGLSYSAEIVATGSHGYVRWQTDGLPAWLKATTNGATLQLSGQPPTSGKSSFTLGVGDFDELVGTPSRRPSTIASVSPLRFELETVEPKPDPQPLRVLTQVLPDAIVGSRFQADIAAQGGEGSIHFKGTVSNATWLELASNGRLSGIPPSAGDVLVHVQAVDAAGRTSAPVALRLAAVAMAASDWKLADISELVAVEGQPFSFQFTGVGGVLPYRVEVEGTLPAGVLFDAQSNRFSGMPQKAGQYALRVTARDSSPKTTAVQKELRFRVLSNQGWSWFAQTLAIVVVITVAVAALIWVSKLRPQTAGRRKRGSTLPWKR